MTVAETAAGSQATAADSTAATTAESTVASSAAITAAATAADTAVASALQITEAASSAASSAAVVPEKYDLKLPAGSTLPASIVERTAANARALGLSNEGGQKLLDTVVAELTEVNKVIVGEWEPTKGAKWIERDNAWKAQALADTEIGGSPEKLETSAKLAKDVVDKFFDGKIAEFLRASGLGSHPEFVRGLSRIGRGMSEGSLVLGAPGASGKPKGQAATLYGDDGMGPKSEKKE